MNKYTLIEVIEMSAIALKSLKKYYGKQLVVNLEELKIENGQIYGLIGPNGAGKSTIMKMICGLQEQNKGRIYINGVEMNSLNRADLLKDIGSLIEAPSYYDNLTGYENLDMVRKLKNLKKEDVDKALDIVGLSDQRNKQVKHYSLGMKQRLGVAMAIIGIPKIIILDEPTNGLDPKVREEVRALIRRLPLEYDTTVMVSSHALDEIERMVNKIGIIANGKLLFQGTINEFKEQYSTSIYLKTSNNDKALGLINNPKAFIEHELIVLPCVSDKNIFKLISKLIENGIEVYRIFEKDKSLEELFIEFTDREVL